MRAASTRIGRWVVPAALITAATSGILFLAADELIEGPATAPVPPWTGSASALVARGGSTLPGSGAVDPDRRSPTGARRARPAPARGARGQGAHAGAAATAAAGDGADPHLGALARARDLPARLRALDELVSALHPDDAVAVLERLLGGELPGTFYEAEALRLAMLGKVARCPGRRADGILLARLDAARPRPERLSAIDSLAARSAGRGELELIAAHDHDVVVRQKARWALQRTP